MLAFQNSRILRSMTRTIRWQSKSLGIMTYTGGFMEARTVDEAKKYLADLGYDHKGAIGY